MSKYDFARRLKRIANEECELVKAEGKIAKKCAMYYEQMTSLKTMLVRQEEYIYKYREEVEMLRYENDKLEKIQHREKSFLSDLILKVEQMQMKHHQTEQKNIEQIQTALLRMNCIRSIKQAAQTFINLNALPERIQGVTIQEKESTSEWKPFCTDSSKHTQIENMIWHDLQIGSVHKDTWESLILDVVLRKTNNQLEEMEI